MSRKSILLLTFIAVLTYPAITIFLLEEAIHVTEISVESQKKLIGYQVSIWISWVVFVFLSVYYKWYEKSNFFFHLTYGFLVVAFVIFGYYVQTVVNRFELPSRFEDGYSHGVFTAVIHIFVLGVLTVFLQTGVWWFTQKWHRK